MQRGGAWQWLSASPKPALSNWRVMLTWQVAAILLLAYIVVEFALEGVPLIREISTVLIVAPPQLSLLF